MMPKFLKDLFPNADKPEGSPIDAVKSLLGIASEEPTSLSTKQIALIRSTWASVGALGSDKVGVLLFQNIFAAAPQAAGLFSFGRVEGFDPAADLASNADLVKHATGVVDTVTAAVGLLDDLDTLGPVLIDLGGRHYTYNVEALHYPIVGGAFLKTLEMGLGDSYTPEVADAYTAMWGVVEATMLSAKKE